MKRDKSIFIKNIYYMLAYAFTALQQEDDAWIATEEFEDMHNLFAAILAKGIGRQLKQGLYRAYCDCKEELPVMHGKIDIPGTIKNKLGNRRLLTCVFDQLSENNLLNQILKATVILLLRHPAVAAEYKDNLKKELLFFSNVALIDPDSIKWSAIRFQRNNLAYRILLGICQLIIEGKLLTTDAGEYKKPPFVDDQSMSRLYEKFILEYYVKEHPELTACASRIPWALDDGRGELLPVMQSDIMLENKAGDKVLIIDAKYYAHTLAENRFSAQTLHSGNLYQIFAYVKNQDKAMGAGEHTVSGMLLYAKTDEEVQPDNTYRMSGNKISVRTLDLNKEFGEIRKQLDAIVTEHF